MNVWTIERLLNSIPVQSQFSSNFLIREIIREAKSCSIVWSSQLFPRNNDWFLDRTRRKTERSKPSLSLSLSLPTSKRINFNPGVVKVFAQRESFHSVHEEWFENLSSRAESAPGLTRIESSNQSPLISPDCLITGTRVYGWIGHKDAATNAKSSFSSIFHPLFPPPLLPFFLESAAIFIGGNRIFFQTPRGSSC